MSAEGGPPGDFGLGTELLALDRFADERKLSRFHLYGYSAGAAVALAYAAERGDRLLSLALDSGHGQAVAGGVHAVDGPGSPGQDRRRALAREASSSGRPRRSSSDGRPIRLICTQPRSLR